MSHKTACILLVDDEPVNLMVLSNLLKEDYQVLAARNGEQALARARGELRPDLILLDVMMPGMDGFSVCAALKADPHTADIPVIFVTAMNENTDEQHGFAQGAVDYITKPIVPALVKARVKTQLQLKQAQDTLQTYNQQLEAEVAKRTQELTTTQEITIYALASLAETRDNETGNHIRRTQHYVRVLAEYLARFPQYARELTPTNIDLLYKSAPLHDVGKVGIPDAILLKPGKLTAEEFTIMKTHAQLGADALYAAQDTFGEEGIAFLRYAREIAACHHEKWDGSGYPRGLAGEEIPLSGRLMALADVYDALISKRVYKPAFSHEQACNIILQGSGTHFDPVLVEAFQACESAFIEIAARYRDDDG